METMIHLTSVVVILCLTLEDVASAQMLFRDIPSYNDNNYQCQVRYCNDMSSKSKIYCRCDDLCWRRRDCCLNYLNKTNVDNKTFYFGIPRAVIERGQMYQCHAINQYQSYGNSVISKCYDSTEVPTESWKWQRSMCEKAVEYDNAEDLLLIIPVSSNRTGETYKNIYCAACHNKLENVEFWKTTVDCPKDIWVPNLTEALQYLHVNDSRQFPICYLNTLPPPDIETIGCSVYEIGFTNTCPVSFLNMSTSPEDEDKRREIEWLCQVTSIQMNVGGTYYENPYCAACNFNETDVGAIIDSKHGVCSTNITHGGYGGGMSDYKTFPVLLDVDYFSFTKGNTVGTRNICPSGSIYDGFTAKCRLLLCSTGYHYHNGHCLRQPHLHKTGFVGLNFSSIHLYEDLEDNKTAVNISNCHKQLYERSEVLLNDNGTLTVNQQKLQPEGTFQLIDNDTVYICVDLNDNFVFEFKSDAHIYMTLVCCSTSVLALLMKMVIFALVSEIRKFPDKLVFCLSASLFIGQLLFFTPKSSTTNDPLCASVAVLTHYFFLSSFCWMNVLAYDICNTFTKSNESRSVHSDSKNHLFYGYSLYAWVIPMLIVSAACVFEWSGVVDHSSIMRPHYGVVMCWICTRSALLFFFAIPMALLLLSNIVFFILTAISIYRSSRASSMVHSIEISQSCCLKWSRSPHHLRFSIYVKLAAIMGLTWISGFVAAFSGQEWLWYVFTITSASQGVYILIALTPCRTVVGILHNRLKCWGKNSIHPYGLNFNVENDLQVVIPYQELQLEVQNSIFSDHYKMVSCLSKEGSTE